MLIYLNYALFKTKESRHLKQLREYKLYIHIFSQKENTYQNWNNFKL